MSKLSEIWQNYKVLIVMVPFMAAEFTAWYLLQGAEFAQTKEPPKNPFEYMEPKDYIRLTQGGTVNIDAIKPNPKKANT